MPALRPMSSSLQRSAAPPALFALIHQLIGPPNQRFESIVRHHQRSSNRYRGGYAPPRVVSEGRLRDQHTTSFRQRPQNLRINVPHHRKEFVASPPSHNVGSAQRANQSLRHV